MKDTYLLYKDKLNDEYMKTLFLMNNIRVSAVILIIVAYTLIILFTPEIDHYGQRVL